MAISDKLNYLIETKSQLRKAINDIGGNLTTEDTFRSYVNVLNNIYDYLPKVTGTGTSITLENTTNGGMRITLKASELSQDATPTPDSPQDIHTISGDNSVAVRNKNLLNIQTIVKGRLDNGNVGYASGTTDLTLNEDSVTFTTNTSWRGIVTDYIEVKEGSTYMFSSLFQLSNQTFSAACYDDNKNWLGNTPIYAYGDYARRFIAKSNTKFIRLAIQLATATTITIDKPQIEESTAPTEYIKHQEQTAPINLPVENLLNPASLQDGFVRADGTLTSEHPLEEMRSEFIKVKPNTKYKFKIYESSWSGFNTNNWIGIGEYSSNDISNFIKRDTMTNVAQDYAQITTTATTQYIIVSARGLASATKVQVNEGDLTSYTPYGTTPIEYCKIGDYEDEFILTSGKNLFDKDNYNLVNLFPNASNTFDSGWRYSTIYIGCKPNTTYTISRKVLENNFVVATSSNIPVANGSITNRIANNSATSITITTGANDNYLSVYVKYEGDTTYTLAQILDSIMINEGSTALPYEPYGTNQWYLKKNIGKVVLDGSGYWDTASEGDVTNGLSMYTTLSSREAGNTIQMFCNKFKYYSRPNITSTDINFVCSGASKVVILNITRSLLSEESIAGFKSWLSTNQPILYYPLATPTYTQITGTLETQLNNIYEKLLSYKGTTNISQVNNDLPFVLGVSAIEDL